MDEYNEIVGLPASSQTVETPFDIGSAEGGAQNPSQAADDTSLAFLEGTSPLQIEHDHGNAHISMEPVSALQPIR
jgi:hypothetical protein